jgi:hypothetical protein
VLYDIVMKFINDFNASAGGEMKLEYLHVGNEQEMHQQVVRGRIQAGAPRRSPAAPSWCPRQRSSTRPTSGKTTRSAPG